MHALHVAIHGYMLLYTVSYLVRVVHLRHAFVSDECMIFNFNFNLNMQVIAFLSSLGSEGLLAIPMIVSQQVTRFPLCSTVNIDNLFLLHTSNTASVMQVTRGG
jgi:hypothetical protein